MAEIIIIATNDLLEKLRQVVLPNRKKKRKILSESHFNYFISIT